jgi:hypothetical protein
VTELEIKGDARKLSQAVRESLASVLPGHHANPLAKVTDSEPKSDVGTTAQLGWTRDVWRIAELPFGTVQM